MKGNPIRTGLVGLGIMGTQHARRIIAGEVPGLTLAAVCDEDSTRLAEWSKREGVSVHTTFASLLASGIDAVIIATPHFSHTTYGIQALEAGKHVLVEKPISVHKADAERLIAAHRGRERQVFAAMFNQRTDPTYRKLKQLITSGELGPIQRISWIITDWFRTQSYYNSGGWRAKWATEGGGVLINQCPHQLDLYQWLFGMPTRVRAECRLGRYHAIEVEDDVTAFLEHANGARGTFITTTGEAPGTNRLEVAADRGKIVIENGTLHYTRNEVPTSEHCRTAKEGFSRPDIWQITIPCPGKNEQHLGILKNFAAACLDGEPLIAPAAEGIHSVELANAMLLSSARNATLDLPIDGAAYASWLQEMIAASKSAKSSS